MSEQQLTTLVERVGDTLQPDVAALVAGGASRGRTLRRRRTIGSAVLGLAAVGGVGLTAVVLLRGGTTADVAVAVVDPPSHVVAVAPADMDATLASLLPGSRVAGDEDTAYQYQVQRGSVRWHGRSVTLTIDARGVGTSSTARERCEAFIDDACREVAGGAWVAEHGTFEVDTRTGEQGPTYDAVRVYDPNGYVVEAAGESGSGGADRGRLLRIALADVWFD